MTGKQMIKMFKLLFPERASHVVRWVDHGRKQITIQCDDHQNYVFSVDKSRFKLEGTM